MPIRILTEIEEYENGVDYKVQGHAYGPGATKPEIGFAERIKACVHAYDVETRTPEQRTTWWERSRPCAPPDNK